MISLVRLNGHPVLVNADLIEVVEASEGGETTVTLTTGNVLTVLDSLEAVAAAVLVYRRSIAH